MRRNKPYDPNADVKAIIWMGAVAAFLLIAGLVTAIAIGSYK